MASGLQTIDHLDHDFFMQVAIQEAILAGERGDKPIGAVLVFENQIIGKSTNTWNTRHSKVHHAENWLCLENAPFLRDHGRECVVYSTLEPCLMCLATIVMADIRNVVFGLSDRYMNTEAVARNVDWLGTRLNNYLGGVRKDECRELIRKYSDERDQAILL